MDALAREGRRATALGAVPVVRDLFDSAAVTAAMTAFRADDVIYSRPRAEPDEEADEHDDCERDQIGDQGGHHARPQHGGSDEPEVLQLPIAFMLLFVYVFGGAINSGSRGQLIGTASEPAEPLYIAMTPNMSR